MFGTFLAVLDTRVMPVDYKLTPEQRKEQAINKIAELKSQREDLRQAYIKAGKIIDNTAKVSLQDAVTLVGECEDFCPEYERWERESQSGDIFRFERVGLVNLVRKSLILGPLYGEHDVLIATCPCRFLVRKSQIIPEWSRDSKDQLPVMHKCCLVM